MPGVNASFANGFRLLASLSPVLLGFFMLMLSVLNQDSKALIFLGGVVLALGLNALIQKVVSPVRGDGVPTPLMCDLVGFGFLNTGNSPSSSSLFIAFTFAYLLLPMQYNNQMNYAAVTFLLCLLAIDAAVRIEVNCTPPSGAILGTLLGFLFGSIWYTVIKSAGGEDMLYFNEVQSNGVKCSRPSKQTFRCRVYKKGSVS